MAQQGGPGPHTAPVLTITAPLLPGGLDVLEDDRPRRPPQAPRPAREPGRRRLWTDVLVVGGVPVLALLGLAALQQVSVLLGSTDSLAFFAEVSNGLGGGIRTVLREVVSATGTAVRIKDDDPDAGGTTTELVVPLLLTVVGPLLLGQLLRQRSRGRSLRQQAVLATGSVLVVVAAVVASALLSTESLHQDGSTVRVDTSALQAGLRAAGALALTAVFALLLERHRSPLLRATLRGAAATTGTALVLGWVGVLATAFAVPGGDGSAELAKALPSTVLVLPSYGAYGWAVSAFGRLTATAHGASPDGGTAAFGLHDRQGLSGALYAAAVLLPLLAGLAGLLAVVRSPGTDRARRALALPLAALLSAAAFLPIAELSVLRLGGDAGLREGPEPGHATVLVLAVLLPLGLLLGLGVLLGPAAVRLAVPTRRVQPWRAVARRLPEGMAWPAALAVTAVLALAGTGVATALRHGDGSSSDAESSSASGTGSSSSSSSDDGSSSDGSSSDGSSSNGSSDAGSGEVGVPMTGDSTVASLLLQVATAEQDRHDTGGSYTGNLDDLGVSVPVDVFVTVDDRGSSFCATANAVSSGTTFSFDSSAGRLQDTDTC